MRAFGKDAGSGCVVPEGNLGRALAGLGRGVVGLSNWAYTYAYSCCEVVDLPGRAVSINIDAFFEVGVPPGSIAAVGDDAGSVNGVEERCMREALAAVVGRVVCVVDWAHILAGLEGEVEMLPDVALEECWGALFEVEVPLKTG